MLDCLPSVCYPMGAEGCGLRGAVFVAPVVRPRTTATLSKSAALGSGPRSLEGSMDKFCIDCGQPATPRSPRCRACAYKRKLVTIAIWGAKQRGTLETYRRARPCRTCGMTLPPHTTRGRPPILCASCSKESSRASGRRWKATHPEQRRRSRRLSVMRFNERNPEKAKAWRNDAMDRAHFGRPRAELFAILGDRCATCGSTEHLHIHHRDGHGCGHKDPNNDLSNLVVLCMICHLSMHRKCSANPRRRRHAA